MTTTLATETGTGNHAPRRLDLAVVTNLSSARYQSPFEEPVIRMATEAEAADASFGGGGGRLRPEAPEASIGGVTLQGARACLSK